MVQGRKCGQVLAIALLLSHPLTAIASVKNLKINPAPLIAQQQTFTPAQEEAIAEAKQLFAEAGKLQQQGTAESFQQAITKYEAALKIWRKLGVSSSEAATLVGLGGIYLDLNQIPKSLEYYTQALAIRRNIQDTKGQSTILLFIGNAYVKLGEKQKAIEFYQQSLSILKTEKNQDYIIFVLDAIAKTYASIGDTNKALDYYNQQLEIQRANNDQSGEADTLESIATDYANLGKIKQSINYLNQSLEIRRQLKDLSGQAKNLGMLGLLYGYAGQTELSVNSLNQALEIQKTTQKNLSGLDLQLNLLQQSTILSSVAGTYLTFYEYSKSLNAFENARSLLKQITNPILQPESFEAKILYNISLIYRQTGQKQKALDVLNQALELQRKNKNPEEAGTLTSLADVYQSTGEYQKAIDFYNQSLTIQRQTQNFIEEAKTLRYLAKIYQYLGNYQLSIETLNQALTKFQKMEDFSGLAQTMNSIGDVYKESKDYDSALKYYNQGLEISRKLEDINQELAITTGIIRVYEELKNYPQALDAANKILIASRQRKNSFSEATALAYLGRIYLASGDEQKALEASRQALSGFEKLGYPAAAANIFGNIAKTYNSLKQYQPAIETYHQELQLRQKLGDRTGEADTLYYIALTERNRGNLAAAITPIEKTIQIVESIRTKVTSQDLRTSYFATVQKYYQFYIDLLMQLHKQQPAKGYNAIALQASERARARSLLEILNEANADIRQGVDPQLFSQERNLQQQLDALEKRRIEISSKPDSTKQEQAFQQETTNLLEQYRQIQAKIRAISPRYAALTQPQPLTLKEIQQQVLDENTLLLEYSLGEERSYLWAITKTSISSYELPESAEIETLIKNFRNEIVKPTSNKKTITKAAASLTQILLTPIAQQLGKKRLVIVGDGALQYVPFAALTIPNTQTYQPLILNHEIITLPSASTVALLRREQQTKKTATKTLALLADPVFTKDDERLNIDRQLPKSQENNNLNTLALKRATLNTAIKFQRLPFTRQEAQEILELVPENQKLQAYDFAANREFVTNTQLSQYRILHFATHGILNSEQPELSGIVLSLFDDQGKPQNGFLRLHDIFNLNLSADLVVLSACQTGLGQQIKGEGLVGLTRGFMYAGSPRVVVSLWNVDDQATALLMRKFYQKMLKDGLKPPAALRQAQIEMLQDERFSKPDYWAAFTLQGEWR
ncbi:CHAT domain-containing protein [Anabaena cylindrica FACHB-243]|uniref:Tetratricopeptide TPR_2 repeat-containing protein n=1 Tax=Anabaena cylindrica (strain ATCC 27899 / PCC 7122) TaxID=272123 RepID=K9ZD39_ANACC|nr:MULTISPECIES: CHAT domain-containing protein [Anabaena]AFZ56634.1 Tetratricopeptide TPR_2 repeat-containing protein [Anabaena cylindrica PCC 7122]MBD2416194.1 CHAT domain-containing protein [Anabaena cylindrica FACHB-243]MBY5284786.1 CHAT domain-containing protein [Anabaena sp. CCAP 1446/1C]MBY5309120.1 CHAT domain-containing protein [Anabaena sp. CCAP 1446/1C]MCM2408927.1 CHAT domain-containing protein [Anabaena sp. CCAP 1446/1C]